MQFWFILCSIMNDSNHQTDLRWCTATETGMIKLDTSFECKWLIKWYISGIIKMHTGTDAVNNWWNYAPALGCYGTLLFNGVWAI